MTKIKETIKLLADFTNIRKSHPIEIQKLGNVEDYQSEVDIEMKRLYKTHHQLSNYHLTP